jgi:hypothetical protein
VKRPHRFLPGMNLAKTIRPGPGPIGGPIVAAADAVGWAETTGRLDDGAAVGEELAGADAGVLQAATRPTTTATASPARARWGRRAITTEACSVR